MQFDAHFWSVARSSNSTLGLRLQLEAWIVVALAQQSLTQIKMTLALPKQLKTLLFPNFWDSVIITAAFHDPQCGCEDCPFIGPTLPVPLAGAGKI
jgi:hypothetical protein